jgi:hypothetical protein
MLIRDGLNFLLQNYDTSESKLRREFEVYGPIKKVRICSNVEFNPEGSSGWRHVKYNPV